MPINWMRILNKNLPKAAAKLAAEIVHSKTDKHGVLDLMKAGTELTKRPAIKLKETATIIPLKPNEEHWDVARREIYARRISKKGAGIHDVIDALEGKPVRGWENAGFHPDPKESLHEHAIRGWLIGDDFIDENVLSKVLSSLYEID